MPLIALGLLLAARAPLQKDRQPIDCKVAARYFQEARWASDDDGGHLWGKTLYGPILFVDPQTRYAVANQADGNQQLHPLGPVWAGTLPSNVIAANTALEWSGVHWTVVMWPLPEGTAMRSLLVLHECWHRIQADIGLPPDRPDNKHLETQAGRTWLQLEWRALSVALISWGDERKRAISDALLFRAYRRQLFPGAAATEDRMEVHEGMAEYTGIRLMGLGDWARRSYISGRLKVNALKPSFAFSFAYETGPAYGLLLDVTEKPWRASLKTSSSLSGLLQDFEGIKLPKDVQGSAMERSSAYDGKALMDSEAKRERVRLAQAATYRKLLIEGPVLRIPMPGRNYSYDPNNTFQMGVDGIVLPETHISDAWGELEVSKGALVNSAFASATVSAPTSPDHSSGDGWKLTLKSGWHVVPDKRQGDYVIAKG